MKIAFWNVGGMGTSSAGKIAVVRAWCDEVKPDLFFLSEISHGINATFRLTSMKIESWATHNDKNGNHGTKDIVLFVRDGTTTQALETAKFERAKAVTKERQENGLVVNAARRDNVGTFIQAGGSWVSVYGIHANASYSGGVTAITCADQSINNPRIKELIIVGGDFNGTGQGGLSANTKKVTPLNYAGHALAFTQWAKSDKVAALTRGNANFDQAVYAEYCNGIYMAPQNVDRSTKQVDRHQLIDYVLCSKGLNIVALNNCKDEAEWCNILSEFDHAPILYQV